MSAGGQTVVRGEVYAVDVRSVGAHSKAGLAVATAGDPLPHRVLTLPGLAPRVHADLYVRWDSSPSSRCVVRHGEETCDLDVPAAATTAYVSVFGHSYNPAGKTPYELKRTWTRPE